MAKYVATTRGQLPGGSWVNEGEEFEFEGKPGLWMKPVAEYKPPAPKPAEEPEPDTLSGMQKRQRDKRPISG